MFSFRLALLLTFALTISSAFQVNAAVVKAVKDKKVLVDMQSDKFKAGDILRAQDSSGKTVALIKIIKVKGSLAEGIFKGKAEKGLSVSLKPASEKKSAGASRSSHKSSEPFSDKKLGVMVGLSNGSATAKVTALTGTATTSMSGMGFSVKGVMDTQLLSWLNFRGLAGFQQFNVTGTDPNGGCGGSCNTKVLYLGADFLARFMFTDALWAGGGASLLFPMTKSSTAITASSISNTLVYQVAAGYDLHFADSAYIPIQVDYDLFPASSTVTASMISARIGYAKTW